MTPADLTPEGRGASFYEAVTTTYELGPDELELLAEVARMLDLLDALREATTAPVIATDRGPIVHPALVEARQVREALRKSLHALWPAGRGGRQRPLTCGTSRGHVPPVMRRRSCPAEPTALDVFRLRRALRFEAGERPPLAAIPEPTLEALAADHGLPVDELREWGASSGDAVLLELIGVVRSCL